MKYKQPKGQILLFAPSYSGKTYLTEAFTQMGLTAYDLEHEGPFIQWCNDWDSKPVKINPKHKTSKWLATHHFLMDKKAVRKFLDKKGDCLILAHAWNIMDCLDLFTKSYFLYLSPEELDRRILMERDDHNPPSPDKIKFIKQKHSDRLNDIRKSLVPIIEASKSPEDIYKQVMNFQMEDSAE